MAAKEITFPDRNKNQIPITQLSDEQLAYWRGRVADELDKDPDGKWADSNRRKRDALAEEDARRANGGARSVAAAPDAPAATTALARAPAGSVSIAGSHAHAEEIAAALVAAERQFHLVSPATQCGNLPEGCEVVISMVSVDADSSDVYPVGSGKFGLSKAPLDRIAGAAGVDWDPVLTRRLDDGRDPHYCAFQAVGYVRSFDGTKRTITGTKEMDLRDGSPSRWRCWRRRRSSAPPKRRPARWWRSSRWCGITSR